MTMTYEQFAADVLRAEDMLRAMATYPLSQFPSIDISIDACECAAEIGGYDLTTARMLNRRFRQDAARVALEMATELAA